MKTLLLASVLLSVSNGFAVAADRPNFLLVFTDDHGYGDVSVDRFDGQRLPLIDNLVHLVVVRGSRFVAVAVWTR